MAVVVQVLVPAEVAGVLFTRDPTDPTGKLMAVEASWGLGEAVVSGRVTPDRFRLDRDTGAVVEKHPGRKTVRITADGEEPVPPEQQEAVCLSDTQLSQLADLGRRVESLYGDARDVEWAFAGGAFYLLQARPITTGSAAERERVRADVVEQLRGKADPGGTVWVRYNLSEVLPAPTPMTWAVVQRLLAADGGFGAMYRDLGARPDPALGDEGAFDLVAGRPMCNLSRLPRMQFARPPFEYPFAAFQADPRRALDPKPTLNPARVGWLRLPGVIWRLHRMATATRQQAETFADKFTSEIAPKFAAEARTALARDWRKLDPPALKQTFDGWVRKTLVDFARDSLKPTVFAELAWTTLLELLKPKLGEERARAAVGEVALGAKPPEEADLAAAVKALAAGEMDRPTFLERFGHRCANEMELAQPRWSEDAGRFTQIADPRPGTAVPGLEGVGRSHCGTRPTTQYSDRRSDRPDQPAPHLPGPARIGQAPPDARLRGHPPRAGRTRPRFHLRGGIFYLLPTELNDLLAGKDLSARIAERRKRRQLELSLEVPPVLFSDDLDAIGRPVAAAGGGDDVRGRRAVGRRRGGAGAGADRADRRGAGGAVRAGVPVHRPGVGAAVRPRDGAGDGDRRRARHGAIVAREFGLPAVAGLPGITRQIRTGDVVRVDGARGTVVLANPER